MTKPPHDLKGIAALLAKKGRGGDTMLAHINPQEAALLKSMGGSGTINPETGLPEFGWWDWNPFTEKGVFGGLNPGSDTFIGDPIIRTARDITGGTAEAIQDVASKLGSTVEAIISDPRKLAGVALMVAFPGAAGAVGEFLLPEVLTASLSASAAATTSAIVGQAAINTAINGGDVKAAITSALIQQGIPAVKAELAGALSSGEASTINNLLTKYGTSAATDAGLAVIMKKDPLAALAFSGVKAATDVAFEQSGLNSQISTLPQAAQDSIKAAFSAKLTNRDPTTAVSDSLFNNAVREARGVAQLQDKARYYNLPYFTDEQIAAIPNIESSVAQQNLTMFALDAKNSGSELTPEDIQKYFNPGSLGDESDLGPEPTPTEPTPTEPTPTEPPGGGGWQGPMGPLTEEQTKRYTDEFSKYLDSLQNGATIPPDYGVQDLGITQENWQSFDQNLQQMLQEGRLPTQWKPGDNGAFTYTDDDGSTLTIDANGNITGYTEAPVGNLPGETPPGGTTTGNTTIPKTPTGGTKPGTTTGGTTTTPPTTTPGTTESSTGLDLASLLALMGGGGQQAQPTQPAVADVQMPDIEDLIANPLQTDYRKLARTPTMAASGGSIDDLLALLNEKR